MAAGVTPARNFSPSLYKKTAFSKLAKGGQRDAAPISHFTIAKREFFISCVFYQKFDPPLQAL